MNRRDEEDGVSRKRLPRGLNAAAGLMALIVVAAVALVVNSVLLVERRESLATATTDNRTWMASQLEADHARLLVAVHAGLRAMQERRDADIAGIRLAYDIFHSRLSAFAFVASDTAGVQGQASGIDALFTWRDVLAERVDSENIGTPERLSEFLSLAESGGAQVRAATLAALAGLVEQRDRNRVAERQLLTVYLAISLGLLLLMLFGAMLSARLWAELTRTALANRRVADMVKRVLDTAPAAILLTDLGGRVIQANPEADRLFGRSLRVDRATQRGADGSRPVDISLLLRDPWRHRIDEGRYRSRVSGPDDADVPVDISVVRVVERNGETFLVFFLTDMSLEERAEREMRVARETSEALGAAKDRFFEAVSHEMRTPLHGCIAALDHMAIDDVPARHQELLGIARDTVQRLHATVEDVLDVTRLGDPGQHSERFRPTRAARKVIAGLLRDASEQGSDIALEITGEPGEQGLMGKPRAFARSLEKYIRLALEAAPGAPVRVGLDYAPSAGDGNVSLTVCVDSTGAAFPDRVPDGAALPDPGRMRASRTEGLQEAAALTLVRAMGSEAHSEFPPAGGGRFRFQLVLPVAEDEPEDTPLSLVRDLHWGGRALVVDDNPTNVTLMRSMVESLGFAVDDGADGVQAVELARQCRYDLIVLDYRMPGATGAEAAAQIREDSASADAVIICVTAILESVPTEERDSDDIDLFLAKPITAQGLGAVLLDIAGSASGAECPVEDDGNPSDSNEIDFDGLGDLLGRDGANALLAEALDQIRLAASSLLEANPDRQRCIAVVHDAIASAGMIGLGRLALLLRSTHNELEAGQSPGAVSVLSALLSDVRQIEKTFESRGISTGTGAEG